MSVSIEERRVNKGIKLLNRIYPDWYKRIDLDTLDMSSYSRCILGQLFREYAYGISYLSDETRYRNITFSATEYGFDIYGRDHDEYEAYDRLNQVWYDKVRILQLATK